MRARSAIPSRIKIGLRGLWVLMLLAAVGLMGIVGMWMLVSTDEPQVSPARAATHRSTNQNGEQAKQHAFQPVTEMASPVPQSSARPPSKDWLEAKQGLERATSYRAFIHDVTSSPTLARVAMAQRAFEACATLAAWAKRPDRPHTDAWHPDLLSAMSRLQERCTPPVADLSLALRHASARLGYGEMVGDAWLRSLIQREGLDALVRLGDGDVLALLGTQLDAATVHGLSPGLNAGLFSAAWVTLACQQYACDSMSWRLRVCLHFDSCSANELSAQLTAAAAAASPQQWAQASGPGIVVECSP